MPILLLYCLLTLVFVSCDQIPQSIPVSQPTIVVVGYDISASTKGYYAITAAHLDSLYDRMARRGGGEVYVVMIQSNSAIQKPLQASVAPYPTLMPVTGIPPRREKIRRANEQLMAEHRAQRDRFIHQLMVMTQQSSHEAYTDIDGALALMQTIASEKRYQTYARRVLLITDGDQELPRQGHVPIRTVTLDANQVHLVRPKTQNLRNAISKSQPVHIHATLDDAILSITI
ncbi:hypothetical protein [Spirosoma harenae]